MPLFAQFLLVQNSFTTEGAELTCQPSLLGKTPYFLRRLSRNVRPTHRLSHLTTESASFRWAVRRRGDALHFNLLELQPGAAVAVLWLSILLDRMGPRTAVKSR